MIQIDDPSISYKEYPGPILLLAGPGTGKTWQLAMRVRFLLNDRGASPEEIAVITFTNEAARNMRERLVQEDIAIPSEKIPNTISTMHSLGNSIVGSKSAAFGLDEEYDVLHDETARAVLMQDAATIAGYDREKWKLADDCRRKGNCQPENEPDTCKICLRYKGILRKCSLVDYDDQIFLACEALKADPKLLDAWQARTRYLLVDEYQDVNQAQCDLIQLLAAGNLAGFFAVGDDDQSIYSFRGGNPKYIRHFEDHFGVESKIKYLSMSWRCPAHILKGARSVISTYFQESIAKPEPTFSNKMVEDRKIFFYDVPSEQWEASIIGRLADEKIKKGSVIVIIPNDKYLPPIKDALTRNRLDFTYKADVDPAGIVRFAALADWVENPDDNVALRYLIDLVIHNHDSLTRKADAPVQNLMAKRTSASEFIANLWEDVEGKTSLYAALCSRSAEQEEGHFLRELEDCLNVVKALLTEKGSRRQELPAFLEQCGVLVGPGKSPAGVIAEVREWKAERLSGRHSSSYPPVKIYNMPSSKGLQGDVVIVIGLSEGLFPRPGADISESSRLMYVAMTRALKELHLFSARRRPGSITFHKKSYQLRRSQFIDAIPADHMDKKEIYPKKRKKNSKVKT